MAKEITAKDKRRIWGKSGYRLFLSHKSGFKAKTAKLSAALKHYGISAFVAHDVIHPSREWQNEIELALRTMDGLAALMTDDFHESEWTDQEIGCAVALEVPIIPVNMGMQPYGFIGKFQSVRSDWDGAPEKIVKALIHHPEVLEYYIEAVELCPSYDVGLRLSAILPSIDTINTRQVKKLIAANNDNSQVRDCWGFNGQYPRKYGPGLAHYLEEHFEGRIEEGKNGKLRFN